MVVYLIWMIKMIGQGQTAKDDVTMAAGFELAGKT